MSVEDILNGLPQGLSNPCPSSSRIFSRGGELERVCLTPSRALRERVVPDTTPRTILNGVIAGLNYLTYGTIAVASVLSESVLRYSGRLVRGVSRGIGCGIRKIYDHFDPSERSGFKQTVKEAGKIYHDIRTELSLIHRRTRDISMVTLSLLFSAYVLTRTLSGGEEKEAAVEVPSKQPGISQKYNYPPTPNHHNPFISKYSGASPIQQLPFASSVPPINVDQLRTQLIPKYGTATATYVARVIDNGEHICNDSDKIGVLYGKIKEGLEQRFLKIDIPRLFGYFDEVKDAENLAQIVTARDKVLERSAKKGRKIDLPLTFVVAALANEGHSLDVDWNHQILDGFANYGLDMFATEFSHVVERGYLSKGFKFQKIIRQNELGKMVESAKFNSKQDAFEAFVATLAYRQDLLRGQLKSYNIPAGELSEEELLFFSYRFYNGAPSAKDVFKHGINGVHQYFQDISPHGAKGNAYVVLTGHEWLRQSGAFDGNPGNKYWWCRK